MSVLSREDRFEREKKNGEVGEAEKREASRVEWAR